MGGVMGFERSFQYSGFVGIFVALCMWVIPELLIDLYAERLIHR